MLKLLRLPYVCNTNFCNNQVHINCIHAVLTITKVDKEELQAAANSFNTVLGKGTFGTVHRGQFKQEVAIKVLYSSEVYYM